jgi:hypothetical protein
MKVVSSREFNHDIGAAKRAADQGPVIVTDRGSPAYVLMTHAEYRRLTGAQEGSIIDLLRQDGEGDFAFEPEPLQDGLYRPASFD